jgi:hypothetical protein
MMLGLAASFVIPLAAKKMYPALQALVDWFTQVALSFAYRASLWLPPTLSLLTQHSDANAGKLSGARNERNETLSVYLLKAY